MSQPTFKNVPALLLSLSVILPLSITLLTSGCGGSSGSSGGGGGGSTPPSTPSTTNEWTWMSGSSTIPASCASSNPADCGQAGVYGTLGTASASNVPGARIGSVGWTDSSGNLWLFGGWGLDSTGATGDLSDLWEFNPTAKTWTWQGGSNTASVFGVHVTVGVYGTQGVASASNTPGGRDSAVSWTDTSGNFWLFGGEGYISSTTAGVVDFNDLWEFNPTTKEWTWVSGSDTINAKGVYGTQGVASVSNVPGARGSLDGGTVLSWTDSSGNFWLFGGCGYGYEILFNDLWEFNPATKEWTWVSGSDTPNAVGVYGTQGVASANSVPGARSNSVSWRDNSGNLWLFGGEGYGPTGMASGDLSDLWEFSPATKEWTWVSGSNAGSVVPVYGTQGVASSSNTPGGRESAVSWTDSSGNLWLFGGNDFDGECGSSECDYLNDLWEFSPATKEWTWVGGSDTGNAKGVYGTLGTPAASNVPGARGGFNSVTWTDSSGNFWLFGGEGYDSNGATGDLNDLWRYEP